MIISVIVPVYNAEKYIGRCINSILTQTFVDFELILVDDGSSDASSVICDQYALQDARIKVCHQNNSGASSARNKGIAVAKGKYICFVDADDYVSCHYLKDLYDNLIENDADLVIQGLIRIDDGHETPRLMAFEKAYSLSEDTPFFIEINIFKHCGPVCKLFKSEIVKKNGILFQCNLNFAEDFDFFMNYLLRCNKVSTSNALNYYYQYHKGSLSTKVFSYQQEYFGLCRLDETFDKLLMKYKDNSLFEISERLFSYYLERVLVSNYQKPRADRNIRLSRLKEINKKFVRAYNKYFNSSTLFTKISKYLFSHGYLRLYDTLNCLVIS